MRIRSIKYKNLSLKAFKQPLGNNITLSLYASEESIHGICLSPKHIAELRTFVFSRIPNGLGIEYTAHCKEYHPDKLTIYFTGDLYYYMGADKPQMAYMRLTRKQLEALILMLEQAE